jgi:UDP-glucuronate 4-epimerase
MAYWTFADALLAGRPVELYGNGLLERDFTYIDDIVAGIIACLDQPGPVGQQRIFNLGNGRPETVLALVDALERHLGVVADRRLTPQPAWDVTRTHADTTLARTTLGWAPQVSLDEGIARFAPWFRSWVARGAG